MELDQLSQQNAPFEEIERRFQPDLFTPYAREQAQYMLSQISRIGARPGLVDNHIKMMRADLENLITSGAVSSSETNGVNQEQPTWTLQDFQAYYRMLFGSDFDQDRIKS